MGPRIPLDIFLTLFLTFFISACGGTSGGGGGSGPPASAAHEWTWMTGANEDTPFDNSDPVYGTQGVASASNTPGGRNSGASWTDHSGNLWLFGGDGLDANVTEGSLNDLWEFSPNTNQWVWVSGSDRADQSGVYGVLGTAATSNVPGGRTNSVAWADGGGNLWLFGGLGYDSNGAYGYLNDLWEFNPSSEEWTWASGSSTVQGAEVAVYGTMGVAAPDNVPRGFADA